MNASYVSATQFTVAGDQTALFAAGRRVRGDCGVDGYKYGTVQSSSYSDPNTTITLEEEVLTSNLTDVHYGVVKPGATGSLPDHASEHHSGGRDPIDHGSLPGLGDDDHTQYIKHALATAANDFLVASGAGVFIKKTLAEVQELMLVRPGIPLGHIGDPGAIGFGCGTAPPECLPDGMIGMPGYDQLGHDNYGNYQYSDGSVMVWVPWFVYRIAHASNPTYSDYEANSVDVRGTEDYPWKTHRITGITKANPAVVTTDAPHGLTAGDYVWLSGITDADWVAHSGVLHQVGTVGSATTFNLQTAAGVDVNSSAYTAAYAAASDMEPFVIYTGAEADGYAVHRAFIDGGVLQKGFFVDKYQVSKNVLGSGYIASSLKGGRPISTAADHNPIADLTACSANAYYEAINAAHARDGADGAVNADSVFFCCSKYIYAALALLSLAHGQAATGTTACAWYHATYNFPKGCNNNALGDTDDGTVAYESDGYSNCGKTGSGAPFAKTTHNGQACGVADLNGLMYEISLGVTCIATDLSIAGATKANPCQITTNTHGLSNGDYVMITSVGGMTELNDKIYKVTVVDTTNFTLDDVDSRGYTTYTSGGSVTKGTFYAAKEAVAMKDFTSGNSGATDHWGSTGVAAMMEPFVPAFKSPDSFTQLMGSGANQVLAEDIYGDDWLLAGLGLPMDADGLSSSGSNLYGKDYYYQYIRNELCLLSCARWASTSRAGVWVSAWSSYRTLAASTVGFRCACYSL